MPSKLDIAREVAAKYLKGIVESDKYALHIARGIVDMVEKRLAQTARLARLEAVAEGMAERLRANKQVRESVGMVPFFTSTDASALAAYEAYMAEQDK